MSLAQFKSSADKNTKYDTQLYNEIVSMVGEPSLIDDQRSFAFWYNPIYGNIRYFSISLDYNGLQCSVQATYNTDLASLLINTTRKVWFEPGRSLISCNSTSGLDDCNALFQTTLMLFEKKISQNEFFTSYDELKSTQLKRNIIKRDLGESTPGKPIIPEGKTYNNITNSTNLPMLRTYSSNKK